MAEGDVCGCVPCKKLRKLLRSRECVEDECSVCKEQVYWAYGPPDFGDMCDTCAQALVQAARTIVFKPMRVARFRWPNSGKKSTAQRPKKAKTRGKETQAQKALKKLFWKSSFNVARMWDYEYGERKFGWWWRNGWVGDRKAVFLGKTAADVCESKTLDPKMRAKLDEILKELER